MATVPPLDPTTRTRTRNLINRQRSQPPSTPAARPPARRTPIQAGITDQSDPSAHRYHSYPPRIASSHHLAANQDQHLPIRVYYDKQLRKGMGTVGAWWRAQDGEAAVDLDRSPIAGGAGSQHEAPITAGTRASPIDVEALGDEGPRAKIRRRVDVVVVDLEADADQEGCGDARTTFSHLSGNKRRKVPPVICLSPDREERSSNQRNSTVRASTPSANAAPKEPIFTCPVCLNKMEQPSATSCGHVFCEKCIKAAIKAQKKCPTCRKRLGPKSYRRVYLPATADQG